MYAEIAQRWSIALPRLRLRVQVPFSARPVTAFFLKALVFLSPVIETWSRQMVEVSPVKKEIRMAKAKTKRIENFTPNSGPQHPAAYGVS